ncbi:MAG: DUF4350 domain-containing protein [Myxococcota bacterium]
MVDNKWRKHRNPAWARDTSTITTGPAKTRAPLFPRTFLFGVFFAFFSSLCANATAQSSPPEDYAVRNRSWNGLSRLLELAQAQENRVDTPAELDLTDLSAADGLLVMYPRRALPSQGLTDFVRSGGRLAVADDFGESSDFLSIFSIERREGAIEGDRLRGNDALPIARPALRHPLVEGVQAVVTNHPTVVRHTELDAVLRYSASGEGPVLTGAVGEGRLVVLGDPSMLINNMLSFSGNERFAANLMAYLGAGGGRILIATPETRLIGTSRDGPGHALDRLEDTLAKADEAVLPDAVFSVLAATLAVLGMLFAMSLLPRRSPYSRRSDPLGGGGYAARIERSGQDALRHACLTYSYELRAALESARAMPAGATDDGRRLQALLSRLEAVGTGDAKAYRSELERMVGQGERLLAKLLPEDAP